MDYKERKEITPEEAVILGSLTAEPLEKLRESPRNPESAWFRYQYAGQFQRINRKSQKQKTFNVSAIVAAAFRKRDSAKVCRTP